MPRPPKQFPRRSPTSHHNSTVFLYPRGCSSVATRLSFAQLPLISSLPLPPSSRTPPWPLRVAEQSSHVTAPSRRELPSTRLPLHHPLSAPRCGPSHRRSSLRMAAVAVPPSPQVAAIMSTRRVPLQNLQNATNSPLRAPTLAGKRQRSHASEQRDMAYGQPPSKKQVIEVDDAEARRHGLVRRSGAQPTALTRKLEAARENKLPAKQADKGQRASNDLDTIRQWQRHYRKLFPQFVFYFDSVSNSHKDKLMSRAQILGSVCQAHLSFAGQC